VIGLLKLDIQFMAGFFWGGGAINWHLNLGAGYEIVFLKLNYSDSFTTVGCLLYTPTD
jgi:hypothetical protein